MIPPVVSAEWLADRIGQVRVADARWYLDGRSGRDAYRAGHIPGAVHVDLDRGLSGPAGAAGGRHPLPAPAVFAEAMGRAGIADGDTVVAYDDAGGTIAARLVWMLRVTGHGAALLDGGLAAWPGALEREDAQPARTAFTARPWPADRLASIEDAAARAHVVLDARAPARYRGEGEALDPRAGHIPGAVSLPCRGNLDAGGRFLPRAVLRRRFEEAGASGARPVVSYCGSGVTACHNLLAMEYAGLPPGRLFPGSWSQWSRAAERPVATGDTPG